MDDFIEVYDGALTPEQCAAIMARFNSSDKRVRGATGHGVDLEKKDSHDITISRYPEWQDVNQLLMNVTLQHLQSYMDKYRFLLMGAMSPTVVHPQTGQPTVLSLDNFEECGRPLLAELIKILYRCGNINVQKYEQGKGGYHHWHSEIYPQLNSTEPLHRVLLFMFFLNDVEEGGQTEFFYQGRKVEAKAGRMVIAPAGFTHTHKGHVARSGDKYIATSWILYQRAEQVYGQPHAT